MTKIERVEWEPKYSVDIEEIDNHQKKMFEMFNQLIDMRNSKMGAKEIVNMISDINEYSKIFFTTEEQYLKRKGYPDFGDHFKSHRQFTKTSIGLRREISEGIENLTDDVIRELRDWLIHHILNVDVLYIPFLRIDTYIEESKRKN